MLSTSDKQSVLERTMNKLVVLDCLQYQLINQPYVRYIVENYFVDASERERWSCLMHTLETLELDSDEIDALKLMLLMHRGKFYSPEMNAIAHYDFFVACRLYRH